MALTKSLSWQLQNYPILTDLYGLKLPVAGRPTIWITEGQGPSALAVGAGGGCLDIFTLIYPLSSLSPSL